MNYWIDVYRANLKTAVAQMLQYRFGILIWAVSGLRWSADLACGLDGGLRITRRYDLRWRRHLYTARFRRLLPDVHGRRARDDELGRLRVRVPRTRWQPFSARLLKPLNPIHSDLAANIAFKLTTSAMICRHGSYVRHASAIASEIASDAAARHTGGGHGRLLRYILQYCLALFAFWTTRVEAINEFYFAFDSFLAAGSLPLALLPAWLTAAAYYSPFRSMGAFPVELLLGRLSPGQVATGFVFQMAWIIVAIGIFRVMWRARRAAVFGRGSLSSDEVMR